MKKDQLLFLLAGLAFGVLIGYAVFNALQTAPALEGSPAENTDDAGPRGPRAPTQVGPPGAGEDAPAGAGVGGGPMVAEINELKRRLQADPQDLAALLRLAHLHHDVAMWPQAAGYYERAIAIEPTNADWLTDLGICYRGMQQFDRALEMFRRAHTASPRHWQSLYNTVIVSAFDLGRFAEAEAALRQLETFDPPPPNLAELRDRVRAAGAAAPPAS